VTRNGDFWAVNHLFRRGSSRFEVAGARSLGFHQYQFQKFEPVEGRVDLALTAFMYLEWYRVQQMSRRGLPEEKKRWWRRP
jgi:hypothetical protein